MPAEPCLCGATDCPKCFPSSYVNESRLEWVANYFPGKRCEGCAQRHFNEVDEVFCAVVEDEADIDDCPALAAQEACGRGGGMTLLSRFILILLGFTWGLLIIALLGYIFT